MAVTYEPIATTTLTSAVTTITFSSIPSTYTDLRLVWTGISTTDGQNLGLKFNSTSSGYSVIELTGNGTSALSSRLTGATQFYLNSAGAISSTWPALYDINIFSYAGSKYKTSLVSFLSNKNSVAGNSSKSVSLWQNTNAITTIDIICTSTMKVGTTATLYGIKAA